MLDRSRGAYTDLSTLASFQMWAGRLPLKRHKRAFSHLAGPYKTSIRGRGMEFEDVRLYQAGDDIRNIDWRVTARTGKPHTKQFREEREKPVLIVLDQRHNMFFGSKIALKSVMAADLCAYIAWAALKKGDRIGGMVFNDDSHTEIRPRNQRKNVLKLLNTCVQYNQLLNSQNINHPRSLQSVLLELKRIARPGTQIILISDFYDLTENTSSLLYDLSRHCECSAIKVYDPLEQSIPDVGQLSVRSLKGKTSLNTHQAKARENYRNDFNEKQLSQKNLFAKYRIPFITLSTQDDPADILLAVSGGSL